MTDPANETRCTRCGDLLFPVFQGDDHPRELCRYRERTQNLKEEEWEAVPDDEDTRTLLGQDWLPVQVFKYKVGLPLQGYIQSIYMPKWLKNSVVQFYAFKWSGMTLLEYLEKMHK